MSNPIISVVMPAYNAEKYIAVAIESILNQTFPDFEFIVIDDGSTDRTWEIIQEYAKKDGRIIALKNDVNLKNFKTRNRGLGMAKGKYVATMDSDDWSYPQRLERQYDFMEKNTEVVLCGSFIDVCNGQLGILNQRKYPISDCGIRKRIFRYNPFCHPVTMLRMNIIKKVGWYDDDLSISGDYEMEFRVGRFGGFANLPEILHKLRTHKNSVSAKYEKKQEMSALFIRLKAQAEYGYAMSGFDKLYLAVQFMSLFIIPTRFRFWIFNYFRRA